MDTAGKYLRADERKAVIVETVVELAGEQNPNGITTAGIAQRMGLTQGALFRHFPNKGAMLESVMSWVASRLLDRLDQAAASESSPLAGLEQMFMAHVDFIVRHPGIPRLLFGELQNSEATAAKRVVETMISQYGQRVGKLLAAGVACGELDVSLDCEAAAILFIGTIQGLVMQSLLASDVGQMQAHAPRVFAIYKRGIHQR